METRKLSRAEIEELAAHDVAEARGLDADQEAEILRELRAARIIREAKEAAREAAARNNHVPDRATQMGPQDDS